MNCLREFASFFSVAPLRRHFSRLRTLFPIYLQQVDYKNVRSNSFSALAIHVHAPSDSGPCNPKMASPLKRGWREHPQGFTMTSEMAFECLLVSKDPDLFKIVARILRQLSITIDVCLRPSRASEVLKNGHTDLLVIDWESEDCFELIHDIWKKLKCKKPTVIAVSSLDTPVPGAHFLLKKPVTQDSGTKSFRAAYQRMLLDYRRHARHSLMIAVTATNQEGIDIPVTVIDIGDGGIGLCSRGQITVGDVLALRLRLPETPREILLHARVLWTGEFSRLGCEFVRIPPVDLMILHEWLNEKAEVKKPLVIM